MRRTGILGALLASVFALGAIAASASAAEYGQCRALSSTTLPKANHGRYSEAACRTLSEKKGKAVAHGDFEWFPGPPANCVATKHGDFTDPGCTKLRKKVKAGTARATPQNSPTYDYDLAPCAPNCAKDLSSSGLVELHTPSVGAPVTCTNSTGTGEITGPSTAVQTFTFHDCEVEGFKCNSPSQAAGVIQTPQLEIHLTDPTTTEVSTVFENQFGVGAPYSFQFECPPVALFRISGSFAALTHPTNASGFTTDTEETQPSVGQNLLSEFSGDGVSWIGPFATEALAVITTVYDTAISIMN
jgi:hypothetical protein